MRRHRRSGPETICVTICACSLTPIWVPIVCGHWLYRRFFPKPSAEERAFRERYANPPRPLPMTRHNISEVAISPGHTTASPLLRLPREIRNHIYSYLFVDKFAIRIDRIPHRLTHSRLLYPDRWDRRQHDRSGALDFAQWASSPCPNYNINLPLIKTCRQIYLEAAPLLYSTNTFLIFELDNLIYLNQTIRQVNMATIRYMHMHWALSHMPLCDSKPHLRPQDDSTWLQFWDIVTTRMTGLVALDVLLYILDGSFGYERVWLKPLMAIRGLKHFDLEFIYGLQIYESKPSDDDLAFRKELDMTVRGRRRPHNTQIWKARSFDSVDEACYSPRTIEVT